MPGHRLPDGEAADIRAPAGPNLRERRGWPRSSPRP